MSLTYSSIWVTLATDEISQLVDFYEKLLGQTSAIYIPNVYAEFHLSGVKLGIFKPHQTHQQEFTNSAQSTMSLCIEVSNIKNAITLLNDWGYPPPGDIIIASHGQEIYAYDPDGNRLIIHQS